MAWKVLSNLKTDVLHKAGKVLQTLEGLAEEEIKQLEKDGVIQNLETQAKEDAHTVAGQVGQDVRTLETQAKEDAELMRGQADNQILDHVQQDIADAERLAKEAGQPVNPGGQPTPEEVQKTADSVS